MNLHPNDALITAAGAAEKPIAFLVGAPLSIDSRGGVPGVTPMLDLARAEISTHAIDALLRMRCQVNSEWSTTGGPREVVIINNTECGMLAFKDEGPPPEWNEVPPE